MEVWIMDTQFRSVIALDTFESLIWTERYNGAGDFELYTPMNLRLISLIKQNYYVWLKESDQMMIVEEIQITTDVDEGDHLIISGRSLESILDRHIIWKQTNLNGNLQNMVKKLLDENIISPEIPERKIPNFVFEYSTDPLITGLTISAQYTGDNLYETLESICDDRSIGFRVLFQEEGQKFVFSLYSGQDRSYDQVKNAYVIFSPGYENILSSNYVESDKTLKNVALVAGEDEGHNRRTVTIGSVSGLARRELYVDARDIQSETSEGEPLTEEEYNSKLINRGNEKLAQNQSTHLFEGQTETTKTFVYGKDFYMGDIVQIANAYEMEQKVRVAEIVRCIDTTGYSTYPTFKVVD